MSSYLVCGLLKLLCEGQHLFDHGHAGLSKAGAAAAKDVTSEDGEGVPTLLQDELALLGTHGAGLLLLGGKLLLHGLHGLRLLLHLCLPDNFDQRRVRRRRSV